MAKRTTKEPSPDHQQPYDNLLKSLFEGQEKQMLPYFLPGAEYLETAYAPILHKAIDEMVKYYQGNTAKLAAELRWMGIVLRRVKTLPRTDKREIQERLNMWDDLMERDPKMKKIRKESEAKGKTQGLAKGKTQGLAEGLQKAVIIAIKLRFPPLTELAQ